MIALAILHGLVKDLLYAGKLYNGADTFVSKIKDGTICSDYHISHMRDALIELIDKVDQLGQYCSYNWLLQPWSFEIRFAEKMSGFTCKVKE